MKKSVAYDKSFDFALSVIDLYKYLTYEKREFVMSKQILRSGTSIGANIREGLYGQSRKDFLHKINIALKEAVETEHWIQLLYRSNYIDCYRWESLLDSCTEIIKILVSTINTTKERGLDI